MYTPLSTFNLKCTTIITPLMMLKGKSESSSFVIYSNTCTKEDPTPPVLVVDDIRPNCKDPPSPIWVDTDAILKALKKPAIALVVSFATLLLFMSRRPFSTAWAASGARHMGGWSSSSSSWSSWSSPSSPPSPSSNDESSPPPPPPSSSSSSSSSDDKSSPSPSSPPSSSSSDDKSSPWSSSQSSPSSPPSSSPSSKPTLDNIKTMAGIILFVYLSLLAIACENGDFIEGHFTFMIQLITSLIELAGIGLEKTSVLQLQVHLSFTDAQF